MVSDGALFHPLISGYLQARDDYLRKRTIAEQTGKTSN